MWMVLKGEESTENTIGCGRLAPLVNYEILAR